MSYPISEKISKIIYVTADGCRHASPPEPYISIAIGSLCVASLFGLLAFDKFVDWNPYKFSSNKASQKNHDRIEAIVHSIIAALLLGIGVKALSSYRAIQVIG